MKYNRKRKVLKMKEEAEVEKKDLLENKGEIVEKGESIEEEKDNEVKVEEMQSKMDESMSMMCPICHFFMNKSVCASCSHMFCQYCLEEYLIFKESCPVCEKSIRKEKITRWCVADSAIRIMLMFSTEEHIKEFERKKKFEEQYYLSKKVSESIIHQFNK